MPVHAIIFLKIKKDKKKNNKDKSKTKQTEICSIFLPPWKRAPMNRLPCLPLAQLSRMPLPAASSRRPSASVTVANTGLLRSKRGRRPEMSKCTLIASAFAPHANPQPLHAPSVCSWVEDKGVPGIMPSLCQKFLRRFIWYHETKTGAAINIFTKRTVGELPYAGVLTDSR